MTRKLQVYEDNRITVTFAPDICRHSGVCVRGLPLVFNIQERRWIQLEHASAAEIAAQVQRCPTGALQFQLKEKTDA